MALVGVLGAAVAAVGYRARRRTCRAPEVWPENRVAVARGVVDVSNRVSSTEAVSFTPMHEWLPRLHKR